MGSELVEVGVGQLELGFGKHQLVTCQLVCVRSVVLTSFIQELLASCQVIEWGFEFRVLAVQIVGKGCIDCLDSLFEEIDELPKPWELRFDFPNLDFDGVEGRVCHEVCRLQKKEVNGLAESDAGLLTTPHPRELSVH